MPIENRIHSNYWISHTWGLSLHAYYCNKIINKNRFGYGTFPNLNIIYKASDQSYRKHSITSWCETIANTIMQSFQKHTENSPSPPATYYGYYIAPNYNPQTMQYNAPNQMAMVIGSSSQHYPGSIVPEVPEVKGLQFSTESIRKGFIRKVYSILLVSVPLIFFQWLHYVEVWIALLFCRSRFNYCWHWSP